MERPLTISQVSRSFGLSPKTLRFYESIGILPQARRSQSGYRLYDEGQVGLLGFIVRAKGLGLTLKDIKDAMALHDGGRCLDLRGIFVMLLSSEYRKPNKGWWS